MAISDWDAIVSVVYWYVRHPRPGGLRDCGLAVLADMEVTDGLRSTVDPHGPDRFPELDRASAERFRRVCAEWVKDGCADGHSLCLADTPGVLLYRYGPEGLLDLARKDGLYRMAEGRILGDMP